MVTVTNITGQKGTTQFKGGTLAEATFAQPLFLCIDPNKNLFLSMWTQLGQGNFIMINEEENVVMELGNTGAAGAPAVNVTGTIVVAPLDEGVNYYSFDAEAQWAPRRRMILHPTQEEQALGIRDFDLTWKQCFATCQLDGMVYTYSFNGQLIKFDPVFRKGQLVDNLLPNTHGMLAFHPVDKNILYIGCVQRHAFYTYNIDTKQLELYAGTPGVVGWRDGNRLEAEFGQELGQFVFDIDNNLVLADPSNHCIRKIDRDGMVSTIIGKGGVSGNVDGNSEDALFYYPYGVAIDEDYTIYIADSNNNRIRKLAIE
jgi:sugar lactone lactonase YvrE